ncbi:MAG: radical SAM protein [Leptospiraceae bacterium]|nr:radical SAM protein [Leptospiraceae bacterium]MCK6380604.1 radical SAM protein [Leptospiraceae bacterium]NUM42112.1 radical SAM protein [Leptospiraceae bacterium]
MRFEVTYQNKKLQLNNLSLLEKEVIYINEYLQKANTYKVISVIHGSPVFSLYQPPIATLSGTRSLDVRLMRKFNRKRLPASATISLTRLCQCECEHCSAVYYNKSKGKKELSLSELKSAILETVELGVTNIILLGGEPLLFKGIFDLIESIPKDKANVIMFTNGEFLSKETCERLKESGLLGAFVSVDSTDPEEHDRLRLRKGLFQKLLKGIQNMNDAGLIPGISSYLTGERLREGVFENMMEFAKNNGAKEVTFFDAIPSGKWLQDDSCVLQTEDRLKINELVRRFRKLETYPGLSVQSTMTSECGSAFCFAANTQFYLTAFGEMCPCDFTPISFGKYPDSSIRVLWEKMTSIEPYKKRSKVCRMQDKNFRDNYIQKIPSEGPFPYPFENFQELDNSSISLSHRDESISLGILQSPL